MYKTAGAGNGAERWETAVEMNKAAQICRENPQLKSVYSSLFDKGRIEKIRKANNACRMMENCGIEMSADNFRANIYA